MDNIDPQCAAVKTVRALIREPVQNDESGGKFSGEKAYRVWKLVGAIIIVSNSACGGGNWIIDADRVGGLVSQ
jgi:hypothetical protein